jgi:hypothetical protein
LLLKKQEGKKERKEEGEQRSWEKTEKIKKRNTVNVNAILSIICTREILEVG